MMNCEQARELIDLHFGQEELPQDLRTHLAECDSCRVYHGELMGLADGIGGDAEQLFTTDELDRAVATVDARLGRQPIVGPLSVRWLRPMLRVAAALLIVATSFSLGRLGGDLESFLTGTDTVGMIESDDPVMEVWKGDLSDELDDQTVAILIDDFSGAGFLEAGDELLGDISEDEYEYLLENFEVGELL